MKVGFVGAGKLGTPVALAMESKGHEVLVCDTASWVQTAYQSRRWPCLEEQVDELFNKSNIRCTTLEEVVRHAEVLFLAVQTPHDHRFGGSVPIPDERKDFDYKALIGATEQVVNALPEDHTKWPVLAVISTVLPGTVRRDIVPLLPEMLDFVYCPFFAAMGTVVRDVLHPEFVLAGVLDGDKPPERFTRLFNSLHDKEIISMSVESAELTKVSYNTYITNKIVIANTIMELAHKTGANCDSVAYALKRATDRIVSPSYMDGGVGDGGACHPRDNIAMSWLAERVNLSSNVFDDLMYTREFQAEWLVDLARTEALRRKKSLVLLGKAYKPETNLVDGSCALLMADLLARQKMAFDHYDPFVDGATKSVIHGFPKVYLICTKHKCFTNYEFPDGSVVVDPFGYIPERPNIELIAVGRCK